jgi:cyclophilin family peptidyl-prolyl cis-trans isomerase
MPKRRLAAAATCLMLSTAFAADPANTLWMEVSTGGRVVIELLPDRAPAHVGRIKKLTRKGFYDGIVFHRVIEGFMAQTGDPTGTGGGGSDEPDLKAEFTDYRYKRGTLGAARTNNPDSANSQFFICFTDDGCSSLTGQYTVFGQVVEGMEFIDKVAKGEPPSKPDKIVRMTVAADAKK